MESGELRLRAEPRSVRLARRFVADFCVDAHLDGDARDTAELLTSELVTNAVLHGGGPGATLRATLRGRVLKILVTDAGMRTPVLQSTPADAREHGRGLMLVDALSSRWGVDRAGSHKTVWFELRS